MARNSGEQLARNCHGKHQVTRAKHDLDEPNLLARVCLSQCGLFAQLREQYYPGRKLQYNVHCYYDKHDSGRQHLRCWVYQPGPRQMDGDGDLVWIKLNLSIDHHERD